jgi:hypothetical protein
MIDRYGKDGLRAMFINLDCDFNRNKEAAMKGVNDFLNSGGIHVPNVFLLHALDGVKQRFNIDEYGTLMVDRNGNAVSTKVYEETLEQAVRSQLGYH